MNTQNMKRFTETTKWSDPWFLDLPPESKLFWIWLCDKCDNSGVVDISWRMASFETGVEINEGTAASLGTRLQKLPTGKYWLPKFIQFQQGELYHNKPAHKQIIALCNAHGIPVPCHSDDDPDKPVPKGKRCQLPDAEWIATIATKYPKIDVQAELQKMEAWLLTPRGSKRQLSRQFIVNWLNRCDAPVTAPRKEQEPC